MASKTYTIPAIQYSIVSIEEDLKHKPTDVEGVIRAWLVTYDKKFTNDIGNSGLSGVVSSSPWGKIAEHAKDNVAEQSGVSKELLCAKVWPGHGTVVVYVEKNPFVIHP